MPDQEQSDAGGEQGETDGQQTWPSGLSGLVDSGLVPREFSVV
ncbi:MULTISPECIES: hypothetical protein [unclassified Bradyrhizobium]|nr:MULTISPECIES: hypothetical protein [unclassified Bradyrhizobium]MBB4262961.1 hypothetical protein [Bradyrhizobium sp. CIR3A]MBB4361152.1 hypothetical protein [Bradyrhizobium sp. CIR18]NYG47218.1 hypothetical protein [Bradyrhizobium sp. IAR9]